MAWIYPNLEQAVEVHAKTIEVSGGGTLGQLDIGKLDSVLQNIQNDDYYPTFDKKLTHLFSALASFIALQMETNELRSLYACKCSVSMDMSEASRRLQTRQKISATTLQRAESPKSYLAIGCLRY